jgi:membrane protease YdiL (CAAX protease family)
LGSVRVVLSSFVWRTEVLLRILLGVVVCSMVGALVCEFIPGEEWAWLRVVVSTLSLQVGALVVVHLGMREEGAGWGEVFGLAGGRWRRAAGMGLAAGLMVLPFAWLMSFGTGEVMRWLSLEPETQVVVETLQSLGGGGVYFLIGLIAVTTAPMAEEVLFRGILYGFLRRRVGVGWGMWVSAGVFGLIHMNAMTFPSLVLLGVLLVWLYELTGSLVAPVVAHAVFNLANLFLLLLV